MTQRAWVRCGKLRETCDDAPRETIRGKFRVNVLLGVRLRILRDDCTVSSINMDIVLH